MAAFPTGLMIDPARSRARNDTGYETGLTSRHRPRNVRQRVATVFYDIVYHGVTEAQRDTVKTFLAANRAASDIAVEYDDVIATGRIIGTPSITRIFSNQYEIAFTLQALTVEPKPNPLFIVVSGQSDAVGFFPLPDIYELSDPTPAIEMVKNPRIKIWQSESKIFGAHPSFRFTTADPYRTPPENFAAALEDVDESITGMRGQGVGNEGWFCAEKLVAELGRDVYMVQVGRGGCPIQAWSQNLGEAMETEISNQVIAAMAAAPWDAQKPDLFIWDQGPSNSTGIPNSLQDEFGEFATLTPSEYADEFEDFIDTVNPKWLSGAPVFLMQMTLGIAQDVWWKGIQTAASRSSQFHLLPSHGHPTSNYPFSLIYGGRIHHRTGPGLKEAGELIADKYLDLIAGNLEESVFSTGVWRDDLQWDDAAQWLDT